MIGLMMSVPPFSVSSRGLSLNSLFSFKLILSVVRSCELCVQYKDLQPLVALLMALSYCLAVKHHIFLHVVPSEHQNSPKLFSIL